MKDYQTKYEVWKDVFDLLSFTEYVAISRSTPESFDVYFQKILLMTDNEGARALAKIGLHLKTSIRFSDYEQKVS